MRPQRPSNPRPRRRSLLIQCEGQKTEPNYLDALCKVCGVRQRLEVKVKAGRGQNAVVTVQAAITEGSQRVQGEKKYDDICCVLDVEHAAHEATLNEAIVLAKDHSIRLFLSNPSFEVWLLAHFERTKRDFADGGAVEDHLNTHWRKHFHCDYEKGDPELYAKLAGRLDTALDNAKWVLETLHGMTSSRASNASTEVYQLIQELMRN
ncbi:MAG: RloB family protein [Janthinobacterium lividum]